MITLINQKPVRSHVDANHVVFNKQDVFDALDLGRYGFLRPIDLTATIPAKGFCGTVMEFLNEEETEAIDVWLRDAIDGNNARHLYPPEDMLVGEIIDYCERVALALTGRTPSELLGETRLHGIEVEAWQEALRYLDYARACAASLHAYLTTEGKCFDEAMNLVQLALKECGPNLMKNINQIVSPYRENQIWANKRADDSL